MSSIGTGVATSVASVSQTAQQTARARDKGRADVQRTAREEADRFDHKLQAAGEASDPDAELPDREAPGYEQLYLQDGDGDPLAESASPTEPDAAATDAAALPALDPGVYGPHPAPGTPAPGNLPGHPLYQHLDIQA